MIGANSKLFGSERRTEVLVLLALAEESFPTEIARLLGARQYAVQQIIDALERESVVATRKLGVERRVTLNPRYYLAKPLRELLLKMADADPRFDIMLRTRRTRPRRRGKQLLKPSK